MSERQDGRLKPPVLVMMRFFLVPTGSPEGEGQQPAERVREPRMP